MNLEERKKRIVARGEHGNHCHVLTGEVEFDKQGRILVGDNADVILRHVLETDWMEGREIWTGEHHDIKVKPGIYEYVPQEVFDPLSKRIERAKD